MVSGQALRSCQKFFFPSGFNYRGIVVVQTGEDSKTDRHIYFDCTAGVAEGGAVACVRFKICP